MLNPSKRSNGQAARLFVQKLIPLASFSHFGFSQPFWERLPTMPLSIETGATSVPKVGFSHPPTLENALFTFSRRWAKIANLRTGLDTVVTITDRGPGVRSRILDLAEAAAKQIQCAGVCPVEWTRLQTD